MNNLLQPRKTDLGHKACENTGRVMTRFGADLVVLDENNQKHRCTARRKFDHVACGDFVCWQEGSQGQASVLTHILPRNNALTRPDRRGKPKAIAANIDLIIIVCAWVPKPSWALVDQYLVAAHQMGTDALILMNKSDLQSHLMTFEDQRVLDEYRQVGYTIEFTNALDGSLKQSLCHYLENKTSIFVGQSGVGKSSLIHSLLPSRSIKVGEISRSGEGRHTTTTADLYPIGVNGYIADSPGVRDFVLPEVTAKDLEQSYLEFADYAPQCRFNNCLHHKEPKCAVKQAVYGGQLPEKRYERYLKKLNSFES